MKILRPEDRVCEIIELQKKCPRIISVVGAGGKTTLIFRLAEELRQMGKRVLITTTTKMYVPKQYYVPWQEEGQEKKSREQMREQVVEQIQAQLSREGIAVTGQPLHCEEKFTGVPGKERESLSMLCDVLLVEADGSRQRPVKVPAVHEPVLFPGTELVIGVLGMRSVGQRILDAAHRPEDVAAFLHTDVEHRMTKEDLEVIAKSPRGLKKGADCDFVAVGNMYEP